MKRKIIIVLLSILLLIALVVSGFKEKTILVIEDQQTGKQVFFYPNDGRFELGYIHSVLLTPVDEYFEISSDYKLMLQKTIYESFGVGLPYEQMDDADFEIVDGKFVLYLNRVFSELNMVISPIPKHTITVNGEVNPILDLFDETDSKVSQKVRQIRIFTVTKIGFIKDL